MFKIILLLWTIFIPSNYAVAQDDEEPPFLIQKIKRESGYYNIFDTEDGIQNDIVYYEEDRRISLSSAYTSWSLHVRLRLRYDFQDHEKKGKLTKNNINRELLYASKSFEKSSLKLGLQELTWGESLIFPIIDLVNPRNVLYPKGFLDSSSKLSVPMINYEIYSTYGNIQLLFIPVSRVSDLPDSIGGFDVEPVDSQLIYKSQEYGMRYKFPLDSLDLNLYVLRHRNREPSFVFKPFDDGTDLKLSTTHLTSFGLSSSLGGLTRVWKLDTRYTPHQNLSGIVRREEVRNLTQAMVGVDQALGIDHTVGVELHYDNWGIMPEAYNSDAFAQSKDIDGNLYWAGLNIRSNFFNQKLKPQIVHFQGINNKDRFSRFKLTGELGDQLQISCEYQESKVASSSPKFILSQAKRILTEIKLYL